MTIPSGATFTDFELDGFNSAEHRRDRSLVIFVWRSGCPTCRLALPFFDRLAARFPGADVVGISQDDAESTRLYCEEHGIGMRQLVDADLRVTRSLSLQSVPFFGLVQADGALVESGYAWDVARLEAIAKLLSSGAGEPYQPLVTDADHVPAFKPG